jgi:CheY-like chemotaxis protein
MPAKKIMIVDDDKDFLEEISELLQYAGYEVIIVNDSLSAMGIARSTKPDLILLDLRMPSMSGFEVAVNLKNFLETCNIPIIAITGYNPISDDSFLKSFCSIRKCLKKPLRPLDVIKEIEWTLAEKK